MIKALLKEMDVRADYLKEEVKTIYFGGGSPSILSAEEIGQLMDKIRSRFQIEIDVEVTLEANPDDMKKEKLEAWREVGINRLSVGIQSTRKEDLALMNRAHDRDEAFNCIEEARKAGFDNLNLDLIYGIPGAAISDWKRSLDEILEMNPEHLSAYSLTIEDRTAFAHWVKNGKIKIPEESSVVEQFSYLIAATKKAGFEHYEISNFALPGKRSRHNSSYWSGANYLGIGPSAHSYNGRSRQWNIRNNPKYIRMMEEGAQSWEEEILSEVDRLNEYLLTGLRTDQGIELEYIASTYGMESLKELYTEIESNIKKGYLREKDRRILLSEKGKLVADKITSDLFLI